MRRRGLTVVIHLALVASLLAAAAPTTAAPPSYQLSIAGPALVDAGSSAVYSGRYTVGLTQSTGLAGLPASVEIVVNGAVIGKVAADRDGYYRVSLTLPLGNHTIQAVAERGTGGEARSTIVRTTVAEVPASRLTHRIDGFTICWYDGRVRCIDEPGGSVVYVPARQVAVYADLAGSLRRDNAFAPDGTRVDGTTVARITNGCGQGCTRTDSGGWGMYTSGGSYGGSIGEFAVNVPFLQCVYFAFESQARSADLSGSDRTTLTVCGSL